MIGSKTRVVIVGAGFGGMVAAQKLAAKNVEITVVDRNNFQVFQPLLYQVSTAVLAENEIAYPIRGFFRKKKNVDFFMACATGVDMDRKVLLTDQGEIAYDYLVLAAGATTNYFGMAAVEKHSFAMKTLEEATRIRNHVLQCFEQASHERDEAKRRELLSFVCVGGGPTGVEEAGGLSELIYDVLRREFHTMDFREVSIRLMEATDKLLPMMPEPLRRETARVLEKKQVQVMLETQVMDCDASSITLRDGTVIPTRTVIWAAGVRAVPFIAALGADVDRSGRILVEKTLQLPHHPEIFALGDCAHFEQDGRPLATIAPVAMQQAKTCCDNILSMMAGQNHSMRSFTYHDVGSMATIGRGQAVMFKGSMRMKGFFAWCGWMLVHLIRLEGIHAKITASHKWFWNFMCGTRLGRIITRN